MAVDRMRMEVDERVTVGEIRKKVEAQKLYEQAREHGQRASVVHQEQPNLFRTSVANIGPAQTVTITIEYLEAIEQQAGRYRVRFPLTITPRYFSGVIADRDATITTETPIVSLTAAVGAHDTACDRRTRGRPGSRFQTRLEAADPRRAGSGFVS